jgi:hypothetical protein
LPRFRLETSLSLARDVRAFLVLKGSVARETAPNIEKGQTADKRKLALRETEGEQRSAGEPARRRNRVGLKAAGQAVSEERRDPPQERIETAHLRQLPDFIIIGTQRGGTTSLYRYLTAHRDIGPALRKEVHFFDRYYEKGVDWYLANFPMRGEVPVTGEASPYYIYHPEVPERVRTLVPKARFIALLRNPVDKAYSHYQMRLRRDGETLSFEDAIDREQERMGSSADPASLAWRHSSYVARGVYIAQLERWMSVFPREQFLIIKSEDFYENPQRVLQEALEYLGLRPWSPANFEAFNKRKYATDMKPATRKRLEAYFEPYNQQLYDLIGRDLGWEHE